MASSSSAPAIGIDLGTTFSCVGVLVNDEVRIISSAQGSTTMPSYVAFTDNGRIVGDRAKQWWAVVDPENTVNNMKRLIGRTVQEEVVKKDIERYHFKVIDGGEGKPKVQVKYEGRDRLFSPEDISAAVLGELKSVAEEFLKKPVTEAVITVPAYFTDAQRQATIDAGTIAGLKVLGTINEPTAAALAYGFENKEIAEQTTVLVYDFGGGTFDVSILSVHNGKIEVLSTGGDGHLGGEDVDDILVDHFAAEFLKKFEIDLFERARQHGPGARDAKRALRRLRNNCEKVKIKLSSQQRDRIELDELFESHDLDATVTRDFFEFKCSDLIRKTIPCLLSTLFTANMAIEDISEIILVGGSTKIPLVMTVLQEVFPHTKFCESINPDEAVAYGAAIQAAILKNVDSKVLRNVHLRDVTPMSLGMETFGGVMAVLIPRNTAIPVKRAKKFSTSKDYQTEICFQVFEGERTMTKGNNLLGEFTLVGIPPAPRGVPQIEVTFTVNENGILKVSAFDVGSECENSIEITNNRGRLTQDEIQRAVDEAKRMRESDMKEKKKVEARDKLETQARSIGKSLGNPRLREKIDPDQLRKVLEKVDESLRLYESYQDPGEVDFEDKRNQLEKLWLPIVTKLWPNRRHGHNSDAPILHDERIDFSILE